VGEQCLNMDHDDEGLLSACETYKMALIDLITRNDAVHHPGVVEEPIVNQAIDIQRVFRANVRKNWREDAITGIRERGG
jgi:hypothetical protein